MDIGHDLAETAKTSSAAIRQRHVDSKYVEVPITIGFDWNSPAIGRIRLTKEAAELLKAGMVLAPAYETEPKHKLVGMGLVPAVNAIPPENIKPPEPGQVKEPYSGFGWYLFTIAIIAGILAIIALLIRVLYVRFN